MAAVQESQPEAALTLFKQVLSRTDEAHVLFPLSLYGAGRAASMMASPASACMAAEYYGRYVGLASSAADKRARVVRALPELQTRCRQSAVKEVEPEPPADFDEALVAEPPPAVEGSTPSWSTIGGVGALGAGVLMFGVSAAFWSEAFDARRRAGDVEENDRLAYGRHISRMESANSSAMALSVAGGLLAATGGILLFW